MTYTTRVLTGIPPRAPLGTSGTPYYILFNLQTSLQLFAPDKLEVHFLHFCDGARHTIAVNPLVAGIYTFLGIFVIIARVHTLGCRGYL